MLSPIARSRTDCSPNARSAIFVPPTVTFGASISFRRALTLSSSRSRASSLSFGSSSTRTVELMLSAPIWPPGPL